MRNCVSCGSAMGDDERFCGECGAAQPAVGPKRCVGCGAEIGAGERFCGECGCPAGSGGGARRVGAAANVGRGAAASPAANGEGNAPYSKMPAGAAKAFSAVREKENSNRFIRNGLALLLSVLTIILALFAPVKYAAADFNVSGLGGGQKAEKIYDEITVNQSMFQYFSALTALPDAFKLTGVSKDNTDTVKDLVQDVKEELEATEQKIEKISAEMLGDIVSDGKTDEIKLVKKFASKLSGVNMMRYEILSLALREYRNSVSDNSSGEVMNTLMPLILGTGMGLAAYVPMLVLLILAVVTLIKSLIALIRKKEDGSLRMILRSAAICGGIGLIALGINFALRPSGAFIGCLTLAGLGALLYDVFDCLVMKGDFDLKKQLLKYSVFAASYIVLMTTVSDILAVDGLRGTAGMAAQTGFIFTSDSGPSKEIITAMASMYFYTPLAIIALVLFCRKLPLEGGSRKSGSGLFIAATVFQLIIFAIGIYSDSGFVAVQLLISAILAIAAVVALSMLNKYPRPNEYYRVPLIEE